MIVVMLMIVWSVARWNRRDRDRGDGQLGMTEQERVARFLRNMKVMILKIKVQKHKKQWIGLWQPAYLLNVEIQSLMMGHR